MRLLAWMVAGTVALGFLALGLILLSPPDPTGTGTAGPVFVPGMPAPRHLPVFITMNLMIGVLIYALTLDLDYDPRLPRQGLPFPFPGGRGLIFLALADPILTYLASRAIPGGAAYLLSRLVLLGGIVCWLQRRGYPPGLMFNRLGIGFRARPLGLAMAAAFWEIVSGPMSFPASLDPSPLLTARPGFSAAWGFTTALYLHSFWQRSLENRWGRRGSLAFPWPVVLPLLAPHLPFPGWWKEALVVITLLYLAAYLFRRTGNLLAPAAFWAMLDLMGTLFRFP